jgi:hemoglobin
MTTNVTHPNIPSNLPDGVEHYSSTKVFTDETVPVALTSTHETKAGSWGLLKVLEGRLTFTLVAVPDSPVTLEGGQSLVIEPATPHFVTPQGPAQFQVDFYK